MKTLVALISNPYLNIVPWILYSLGSSRCLALLWAVEVGWFPVTCEVLEYKCGMVGYICYCEKEPCVNEMRPDGMLIVKQQDMEVLGVDLSPSISIKDRFLEPFHVLVERMPNT
jgi:hypothetical protein